MRNVSTGPYIAAWCCLQLVALFGEVMEPLGGRALLVEVRHWGWDLRLYSLAILTSSGLSGVNPGYSNSKTT